MSDINAIFEYEDGTTAHRAFGEQCRGLISPTGKIPVYITFTCDCTEQQFCADYNLQEVLTYLYSDVLSSISPHAYKFTTQVKPFWFNRYMTHKTNTKVPTRP